MRKPLVFLFVLGCLGGCGAADPMPDAGMEGVDADQRPADNDSGPPDSGPADRCATVSCPASSDPCAEQVCDPDSGMCVSRAANEGMACNDGDLCTVDDTCRDGTCIAGTTMDCGASSDACNVGRCDSMTGRCMATPVADDTPCDDGNRCTEPDRCMSGLCVAGSPRDCSSEDDACHLGMCDARDGSCRAVPRADGTPCDDGNLCTRGETCGSGACLGGTEVDCAEWVDQCNTAMCVVSDGSCQQVPVMDGTPCDDGVVATVGDACLMGRCAGEACENNDGMGPWAFGHEIVYEPRTLSSSATSLTLGDDSISSAIPIGFNFDFFGERKANVYVSSNGFVTFSPTSDAGCCTGDRLPIDTEPGDMLALYWQDLNPPGGGTIRYEVQGRAPYREFVLEFDQVPHCCSSSSPTVSVQMVLYENTGLADVICIACNNDRGQSTQGLQNATRTFGYAMPGRSAANTFAPHGDAVRYETGSSLGPDGFCDTEDPCPALNPAPTSPALSGSVHALARRVSTGVLRPMTSRARTLSLGDDEVSSGLALGFDFEFFGTSYDTVYVSSNGWLSFTPTRASGCCAGADLPSAASPANLIAAYWGDLDPSGGGRIQYEQVSVGGSREFVVTFNAVPHYGGVNPVTFQVRLLESSDEIQVYCIDCPSGGDLHTQGLQDVTRTYGYSVFGRESRDFSLSGDVTIYQTFATVSDVCALPVTL